MPTRQPPTDAPAAPGKSRKDTADVDTAASFDRETADEEPYSGKIIDLFLELWAITAVTAVAGSFSAFFHRRGMERDPM